MTSIVLYFHFIGRNIAVRTQQFGT